jgi:hypothetical protein
VRGSADKTLIYLTLHTVQCLVKCEKIDDKATAIRELRALSTKQFALPGESSFPLAGLMNTPVTKAEGDAFKAYFKQAREELSLRLCERLFEKDGTKSKVALTPPVIIFCFSFFVFIFSIVVAIIFEEEVHGQGDERLKCARPLNYL